MHLWRFNFPSSLSIEGPISFVTNRLAFPYWARGEKRTASASNDNDVPSLLLSISITRCNETEQSRDYQSLIPFIYIIIIWGRRGRWLRPCKDCHCKKTPNVCLLFRYVHYSQKVIGFHKKLFLQCCSAPPAILLCVLEFLPWNCVMFTHWLFVFYASCGAENPKRHPCSSHIMKQGKKSFLGIYY